MNKKAKGRPKKNEIVIPEKSLLKAGFTKVEWYWIYGKDKIQLANNELYYEKGLGFYWEDADYVQHLLTCKSISDLRKFLSFFKGFVWHVEKSNLEESFIQK